MQQLLSQLCDDYIGIQYTSLITTLYLKPQTLQSLASHSDSSYKRLIQKLKYLINFNIITYEKSASKEVVYSLNVNNVLFFQRIVKYYKWVEENCGGEEGKVLGYFLEERTANFERYVKEAGVGEGKERERVREVFVGLVKEGYLYEDEKALDLGLCERRADDVEEKLVGVGEVQGEGEKEEKEEKEEKREGKQSPKGRKSNKKSLDKKPTSLTKDKQTKGKKKAEIKIVKTDSPLIPPPSSSTYDLSILSKVSNPRTYFSISLPFILSKIKDLFICSRLRLKFNLPSKPLKHFLSFLNSPTYPPPFDIYNSPLSYSPKTNLLKDIHLQLIQQYIYLKFGQNSLLIYKTLVDNQYITEKSLLKYTLLDLKELRAGVNLLYVAGVVKSVEVKIDRVNTMVFWVDEEVARREYEGFLTKTCLNLDILGKRFRREMEREEGLGQGGKGQEMEGKLWRLEANLLEVDDCLILYKE